ncbi:MAG: DUF4845 domain-containing protein, partial [Steroidobacteraceae bacterium]
YGGVRLVPVYLEYGKVARALDQVREQQKADDTSPAALRNLLERRWDVEDIQRVSWKDIRITRTNEGYEMVADYVAEEPFIGNLYKLAKFNKTVTVPQ